MSDDARRLLFLREGQVHVLDTATLVDRTLTSDPAHVTEAALSGDGKIVYAVTGRGRLLKINVDDGSQIELIGHTPYLDVFYGPVTPGLTATLSGSGLSDSVINGTLPLNAWLGNVTMWIGERKVPVVQARTQQREHHRPLGHPAGWRIDPYPGRSPRRSHAVLFSRGRHVPLTRSRSRGRRNPPSGLDADLCGTHQHR